MHPARLPVLLAVLPGVLVATSACGPREDTTTADCTTRIRVAEVVMTARTTARHPAARHGWAELAACHDVGPGAEGSVFSDARRVRTWAFEGLDPAEVLGVRTGPGAYAVLVADTVASADVEHLLANLSGPPPAA